VTARDNRLFLEAVLRLGLPNSLRADGTDAGRLGHGAEASVRGLAGRVGKGQVENALHNLSRQRRLAGFASCRAAGQRLPPA